MTNGSSKSGSPIIGNISIVKLMFKSLFGLFIAFEFFWIFNSSFLAIVAAAFLFFIPIKEDLMMVNSFVFAVLMGIAVFMAFNSPGTSGLGLDFGANPWDPTEWDTGVLVFLGVWAISFLAGLFADSESRQFIGVMMILVTFVLFAVGPGTQEVGTAFFGDWWPRVYTFGSQVLGPFASVMEALENIFGPAFEMLINPMGFAQKIMSGDFTRDPTTGLTGAFGVELESITSTPIYPYQPFTVVMNIKNKGAFEAENVKAYLEIGDKAPREEPITKTKLEDVFDRIESKTIDYVQKYNTEIRNEYTEAKGYISGKIDTVKQKAQRLVDDLESREIDCQEAHDLNQKLGEMNTLIADKLTGLDTKSTEIMTDATNGITEEITSWRSSTGERIKAAISWVPKNILGWVWKGLKFEWDVLWEIFYAGKHVRTGLDYTKNTVDSGLASVSSAIDSAGTGTNAGCSTALQTAATTSTDLTTQITSKLQEYITKIEGVRLGDIVDTDEIKEQLNELSDSIAEEIVDFLGDQDVISISEMGFSSRTDRIPRLICSNILCIQSVGSMTKLEPRQLIFDSSGPSCTAIVNFGLTKKFIPVRGTLSYHYQIDSLIQIEAISQLEWNRRVEIGMLTTQIKKHSQMTNSPVKMNIDTLEQPILEGKSFHLAIQLESAQGEDTKVGTANMRLEYPLIFEGQDEKINCNNDKYISSIQDDMRILEWKNVVEPHIIYCYFDKMPIQPVGAASGSADPNPPEITYNVYANASYAFRKWTSTNVILEFGGTTCCETDEDCPPGVTCDRLKNTCGGYQPDQPTDPHEPGGVDYCKKKMEDNAGEPLCAQGEGQCHPGECLQPGQPGAIANLELECVNIGPSIIQRDLRVCCEKGITHQDCYNLYDVWPALAKNQ
jgi:hypothetical protein